ncbi:MAG: hemolysin family protein [Tannerellaceae bacterium]|jgi:putative hemolysin|nr:hemolysin family protein [Tannerellaceae bacterium]
MEIVVIAGLIILNGVLSMVEIALVSARKIRLEIEAKKGVKSASKALMLVNCPETFLPTIQIGITLVGVLTGLYSGEAFAPNWAAFIGQAEALRPYAFFIAKTTIVVLVTFLTLVFGELVPKHIGMDFAEQIAKWAAAPMRILSIACSPFVWLLSRSTDLVVRLFGLHRGNGSHITEEEIKAIVKEGRDGGEVQEVEQDIVGRVFNLGDRNLGTIMTHRSELVWLDLNDSPEVVREKIQSQLFNIYPVASERLDKLCGVVYLKDIFLHLGDSDFSLKQILRPAKYLPENQSVYNALSLFKQARIKYGIVTDEFGGIQGIVTLKDIMEGLIGQISEVGEEPDLVQRTDGSWLVDGQLPFYDFLSHFNAEDLYAEYEHNTLSGLILELLEHVPRTGEQFTWCGFDFEIVDMDGTRIDKVLVKKKITI